MRTAEKLLHKEQEIERRYNSIKELFSVDGLVGYFTSSISSVTSIFDAIYKGYSFVVSLFSKSDNKPPTSEIDP